MVQELNSKNLINPKINESQKQSEDDSEETEVSQNHLRKLENMARNISLGNKSKKDSEQNALVSQKTQPETNNPKTAKTKEKDNRSSPKGKSIIPSDSYAQNIGFGRQVKSPVIPKNKALPTKSKRKSRPVGDRETNSTIKKQSKSNSSVPLKKLDSRSTNYGNKQVKLHQKYTQNNAMTHTPNPKVGAYNPTAHSRKSQTPEPKVASNLINNLNREPLITTELTKRKYCLVLDLDETLIHFKNDNGRAKFLIRPYTYNFLRNLEPHFELIIFTAAQKEYADWILDKIDNKVFIN